MSLSCWFSEHTYRNFFRAFVLVDYVEQAFGAAIGAIKHLAFRYKINFCRYSARLQ
jgi:hypothetical protein